jgi:imidazolonepropionase-like amidohydrolase
MKKLARLCALLLLAAVHTPAGRAQSAPLCLVHAHVIVGEGGRTMNDASILLREGKIAAVGTGCGKNPAGTQTIDLSGMTVMPGLLNAHGHLALNDGLSSVPGYYTQPNVLAALRQYEKFGVTGVLSLGLNRDLLYEVRAGQRAGRLDGATVFSADRGYGVPGGAPPAQVPADQLYRPATAEQARREVDEAAARHPDYLKIWMDDLGGTRPEMSPAIYGAILEQAHRQHLRVAAHVYHLADARALAASGVDTLAHSIRDAAVDPELIAAMKARGTWYIPTLTVDDSFFFLADHPDLWQDPFFAEATNPRFQARLLSPDYAAAIARDPATAGHRRDAEIARRNLKVLFDAGVKVAFGTDSGANPSRIPGYAEHRELELMVAAGLRPIEAIECATGGSAALLGESDRLGTVARGHSADLVILAADPLLDIRNTRRLVAVFHQGRQLAPAVAAGVLPPPR